jgi:hypothetical protein
MQAFGVYEQSVYHESAARKKRLNVSATTAAQVRLLQSCKSCTRRVTAAESLPLTSHTIIVAVQCVTLVRKSFPDANAAEFSNTGQVWCAGTQKPKPTSETALT